MRVWLHEGEFCEISGRQCKKKTPEKQQEHDFTAVTSHGLGYIRPLLESTPAQGRGTQLSPGGDAGREDCQSQRSTASSGSSSRLWQAAPPSPLGQPRFLLAVSVEINNSLTQAQAHCAFL